VRVETFAERVLRRPLWPHQLEAAHTDRFITCIAAARRTGKSTLAEVLAIHTAFSNAGCRVLILSATQDAARRVTEAIGETLARNPETRGAVIVDHATRIRLGNGSQIISLPASQRQVRGYGERVLLVILDEASFMPAELWTAASYVALDERANGSRIVMLGTPFGGSEHFFRQAFLAGLDASPDHAAFNWTFRVNPKLDHAYLERQRDRISPAEYSAEILGEWSDAVGQLFPDDLLAAQTAPFVAPTLAEMIAAPAQPSLGLDWAVSFDKSAAAAIYRLPGGDRLNVGDDGRPKFVLAPHSWPAGTRFTQVVDDVHRLPARYINSETNGVGAGPSQQLEEAVKRYRRERDGRVEKLRWNFVATTNAKKTAGYGCILGLAERGQLFWPADPEWLRQLRGLRFEQGERGFTKIEAEDAIVHDDITDAAMLATMPYSPRKGRIVCHLQKVANPRYASPDCVLPGDLGPVVESGSGYRIYERPPLQSITGGGGLTLPPGTVPTDLQAYAPPLSPQVRKARELLAAKQQERTADGE
jgi:hypothetical protein